MNKDSKIYVAGHNGLVGSAIMRNLKAKGYTNIITRSSKELDLTNQQKTKEFFEQEKPEYVFLAAAKVGGIQSNIESPADFIYTNIQIQNNVIKSSYEAGVKKLLFLGSSCIYPRLAPQPMKEEYLLTGKLEPTNEAYAIAKISGLKMCEFFNIQYNTNYISLMPSNVYGENDHFNNKNSHVVSALISKFHEAKVKNKEFVEIWGTGNAMRELLYVDDLAEASIYFMNINKKINSFINIGTGIDVTIKELAETIKEVVGFKGQIKFDPTKPDGMPRKVLDVSKSHEFGWHHNVNLREGLEKTYKYFLNNM